MYWRQLSVYVLLSVSAPVLCQTRAHSADAPPHEAYALAAWKAFGNREFRKAITHADECIREFHLDATQEQKSLKAKNSQVPLGQVSDAQKQTIHKSGVLNDVAACLYIKGRAATALSEAAVAREAFTALDALPDARAWDERGWFWSPLEAAKRFMVDPKRADEPPHATYVDKAWEAFNSEQYRAAIDAANSCLEQFHRGAVLAEESLKKSGTAMPTGAVDERTQALILQNGLLNDVSTCLWIKGRSAERIGDNASAIEAYRTVKALTFGRTWDPNGWFWSPSASAIQRLQSLE